jgi:hypothetical protein
MIEPDTKLTRTGEAAADRPHLAARLHPASIRDRRRSWLFADVLITP